VRTFSQEHRAKLKERIGHFFGMVGREDPKGEAELVLKLETQMAEAHEDKAESRRDHGKVTTWEEVDELVPNWPWQEWLKGLAECTPVPDGGPSACEGFHKPVMEVGREGGQPLLIRSQGFFQKLDGILKDQPLEAVKSLMRWKIIKDAAPSMSAAFLDSMVELNKDIYGTKTKSPRERKCYFSTMSTAGWPAAKIYADKVFHRGNIKAAEEMLAKIRAEFDEALAEESWMAPEDRKKAQYKLQHMFFQVGVPTDKDGKEHWPKKTEELDGKMTDSLYKNECVAKRQAVERSLKQLTEVPNRRHWGGSTPLAVNAFYGPSNNGLWIPAGILQKPFFDEEMGDARNYGAIGAVLGHEMSHGFDDNGRQYDANGELHDWWSPATVEGFKKGSQCISDLFSSFSVKGRHVNGDLTLGEDIADSGGLKFSFKAFTKDGGRTSAEKRLFFTAFAQVWCQVSRRKSAVAGMLSDPHAPAKFRVIGGLSQNPEFSEAFACPLGSPMSPADKCSLW
jgi:predicted metalloendopeptidase